MKTCFKWNCSPVPSTSFHGNIVRLCTKKLNITKMCSLNAFWATNQFYWHVCWHHCWNRTRMINLLYTEKRYFFSNGNCVLRFLLQVFMDWNKQILYQTLLNHIAKHLIEILSFINKRANQAEASLKICTKSI